MRFPWERDLRRTCDKCGESWVVPYLLRRHKPESWRKSARSTVKSARSQRSQFSAARQVVDPWRRQTALHGTGASRAEAAEAERQLIDGLARCSACLSTDFTDTPIRD